MYNRLLDSFICVADCGSFTKAAEKLYISSTAVMKQMNQLETQLNLKLLIRSGKGIRLTAAGEAIYKEAKVLIARSAKVLEQARTLADAYNRTICVGTSMLNPCKPFMDLWYHISDRFPGYKIHIVPFEDDHQGILSVIDALGVKFDFLVGACDASAWLERCNFLPLGKYQRCVAFPIGHRLAGKKKIELTDLHGETLIMIRQGESPGNDRVRKLIEREHPQITIENSPSFYDIEVFNRCHELGCALSIPECWKDIHPSLVAVPVDWGFNIPYGLLYAKQPPEDIARFVRLVDEEIKGLSTAQI